MMAATAREIAEKLMRGHPTPHDLMSEFRASQRVASRVAMATAHGSTLSAGRVEIGTGLACTLSADHAEMEMGLDYTRSEWRAERRSPRPNSLRTKVCALRKRYASGESALALARSFGIGRSAAYRIIHGKTWKHLPLTVLAYPLFRRTP